MFSALFTASNAQVVRGATLETGGSLQEKQKEYARAVREMDVQRSEVARHAAEDGHEVEVRDIHIIDRESN